MSMKALFTLKQEYYSEKETNARVGLSNTGEDTRFARRISESLKREDLSNLEAILYPEVMGISLSKYYMKTHKRYGMITSEYAEKKSQSQKEYTQKTG